VTPDDERPIPESGDDAAAGGDLAPAKVLLPEAFRREFAEVMGKVRVLVEDAERVRSDRETGRDLSQVLEANATLLRTLLESQQRLLGSDERAQKLESLAVSTRALNDTFRAMSKSQEALAARLETKERSRRWALGVGIGAIVVAGVLAGAFAGTLRERAHTDELRADLARLKDDVGQNDRDRLASLAGHYEDRNDSLQHDVLAGQSELQDSKSRLQTTEEKARTAESALAETRTALAASEALARSETERADRLASEIEVARRAIDSMKDEEERRKAEQAARESSAPQGPVLPPPVAGPPAATVAAETDDSAEKPEEVDTDRAHRDRVVADFNRAVQSSNGTMAYRLTSIGGVGAAFLHDVVVDVVDRERATRKSIEAAELEVATDAAGEVELRFRDGRLVQAGRPFPFLNGHYTVPMLGLRADAFSGSSVPIASEARRKS
jgi:hypothetical protein